MRNLRANTICWKIMRTISISFITPWELVETFTVVLPPPPLKTLNSSNLDLYSSWLLRRILWHSTLGPTVIWDIHFSSNLRGSTYDIYCCRAYSRGTVTTCINELNLSWLNIQPLTSKKEKRRMLYFLCYLCSFKNLVVS